MVVNLFSRQVVGWPMGNRIDTCLVLNMLLMPLWRLRSKESVRYIRIKVASSPAMTGKNFLRDHKQISNMSRRDNYAEDLEQTLMRYVALCHHHLNQSALHRKCPYRHAIAVVFYAAEML